MILEEMVELIEKGVPHTGGTWADFGAGAGNFTRALRELVGEDGTLYAIDRDQNALARQNPRVKAIVADFTQPIPDLPSFDGILLANALHFVRNQRATLVRLVNYLKPGGTLLVVEYDVSFPRGYIPFPLPYAQFKALAREINLVGVNRVGERPSPSTSVTMYAAAATTPQD